MAWPWPGRERQLQLVRIVLLGLPGAGKSTQSAMLARHYSLPVISAGALLREAVEKGTGIGRQVKESLKRGELAPNHLVDQFVFARLRRPECAEGFILDGFPRTLDQAKSLDEFMRQMGWRLSRVIFLVVPDAAVISRLTARRLCPICGAIYSLSSPFSPGEICYACHSPLRYLGRDMIACEACGVPFTQREDDRPEVLERRLQIQKKRLRDVLSHYQDLGVLVEIDGNRTPQEVFMSVRTLLDRKQRQAGGIG